MVCAWVEELTTANWKQAADVKPPIPERATARARPLHFPICNCKRGLFTNCISTRHCRYHGHTVKTEFMEAKVIRTEEQYAAYLDEVQALISEGPKLNSKKERAGWNCLTVLLEAYENSKYPVESPDPIDAILFRMNEKGLKQS